MNAGDVVKVGDVDVVQTGCLVVDRYKWQKLQLFPQVKARVRFSSCNRCGVGMFHCVRIFGDMVPKNIKILCPEQRK